MVRYGKGVKPREAISIMNFFTGLELSRSQADSLLTQRADAWELQYHATAELIALQTSVAIDETGWKVAKKDYYLCFFRLPHVCCSAAEFHERRPRRQASLEIS